jgi:hypothetical protein
LAKPQLEKAVALAREGGNRVSLADWLLPLGRAALYRSEFKQAIAYLQECYDLWHDMGVEGDQANALTALAALALATAEPERAARYLNDSLSLWVDLWQRQALHLTVMLRGIVDCLLTIGQLAHPAEAVTLLAAAEQIRASLEYRLEPAVESARQATLNSARQALSEAAFDGTWADGQSLSLADTFNLAYHLLGQANK